jgi:type II secretory pathway pseudopilin PulG
MEAKLTLRDWIVAIILVVMVATVFLVPAYVQRRVDEAQANITCLSARANIQQLEALREISDRLGLPTTFRIPTPPPECL